MINDYRDPNEWLWLQCSKAPHSQWTADRAPGARHSGPGATTGPTRVLRGGRHLTDCGGALFERFGLDLATLRRARRPLCRACLDWSERRSHLGGALGAAVLQGLYDQGWACRERGSRAVRFTVLGLARFRRTFIEGQ